jgi:hypothetical protein
MKELCFSKLVIKKMDDNTMLLQASGLQENENTLIHKASDSQASGLQENENTLIHKASVNENINNTIQLLQASNDQRELERLSLA